MTNLSESRAYKLYRHPGLEPGSIAQPLVAAMSGSRLKAGMTKERR